MQNNSVLTEEVFILIPLSTDVSFYRIWENLETAIISEDEAVFIDTRWV